MAKGLDANEFRSVMDELIAAVDQFRLAMTGASKEAQTEADAYRENAERARDNTKSTKDNTKATEEETKAKKKASFVVDSLTNIVKAAGREFLNIGNAGIKLGASLGTSATKGVQLEVSNRLALVKQFGNFSADLAATMEQVQATQKGFADAFVGVREGTQLSAEGTVGVISDLKKGFKSEFEPTADSFRILTQMGITTATQMDNFRKGTGRASLSAGQLSTLYNKNQLSFLLYGNSFGKAAVQAERLGINLASVQAAQEGLVTNLDGTLDTVNQLNQLGAQLDFGTLIKTAEQDGPDALMAYVRRTIPEQMMQSASTRSLFKQLGISVEDYMKSGSKQVSAADQLEKRMTEAAKATNAFDKAAAGTAKANSILTSVLGELKKAVQDVIMGLGGFVKDLITAGLTARLMANVPGGRIPKGGKGMGLLGRTLGLGIGGASLAIGSAAGGASLVEQGKTKTGTGLGIIGGGVGGLMMAAALAPFTGGLSLAAYGTAAAVAAAGAGGYAYFSGKNRAKKAEEAMAGTPSTADAAELNRLLAQGVPTTATQTAADRTEMSRLIRKMDELISTISNAKTTIMVNGTPVQTVPRMQTVGVHSRNEVR